MIKFIKNHPPAILILGFLFFALVGGVLLNLPYATNEPAGFIRSFFNATSMITVTGLLVSDVGNYKLFGQIVTLVLIQLGGTGFMTFATLIFMNLRRGLEMTGQLAAKEAFGNISLNKITSTAKAVFLMSLLFEFIGWLIMTLYWANDFGWYKASYRAFFYAISAFNNAGISPDSAGLTPEAGSVIINLVITSLIILGGLGFLVLIDIGQNRNWKKLSVNSRLVLMATLIINIIAFLVIFLVEKNNPKTLGNLGLLDQVLRAWFQAITPRTAGFNTIDTASMTDSATFLTMMLMFIGGGSISTAGGLKIGTFVVLLLTTLSYLRQQEMITVYSRTISNQIIRKAIAVVMVTTSIMVTAIFILLTFEKHHNFLDVAFEVISALSTVGLSRGITSQLSQAGEITLICMMFAGRLGPLTLAYFIAMPKKRLLKFPESNIYIG